MKKLLITGFEPFGGDCDNASWEAVSRLPDTIAEISLCKRQVPVEYDRIGEVLRDLIDNIQPDWVICVGQAANRSAVTPEKVAINWKCGSIPDNAGILYKGEVIRPDGPDGYFSTLPVEKMVETMRNAGVPAQVSFTAGTYVCNTALYELLHDLRCTHPQVLGCFIHVPYLCHQVLDRPQSPSLPIDSIVTALTAAVTCLNTETEA